MTTMLPRRRRGATAIEYGLIAGLIIIVTLLFLTLTGVNLKNIFDGLGTSLQNAQVSNAVDPYAANGIAPPTGAVTLNNNIPGLYGPGLSATLTGYTYSNGQVYSAKLPLLNGGSGYVTVYSDGFTASPSDISAAQFAADCANTGLLPGSNSQDYKGATFSVASNGNYVCGGGARVPGYTLGQSITAIASGSWTSGGSFW